MGMYTLLKLGFTLKADTPQPVINIILYMMNLYNAECPKPDHPDHPLFKTDRWDSMLLSGSGYFNEKPERGLARMKDGRWAFACISSFKNYDSEIQKFTDWIAPYVDRTKTNKIGLYRYEEYHHDQDIRIP